MAIQIKSFNQSVGDMIRKIRAESALNDLNTGSLLLTILEAAAANDFENNAAILNVLELLNIDAIKNNDLDAKAGDFGLSRYTAAKASGLVNILNTNISKRSTGLYVIKPAPIAGQTKLYVNNTSGWEATGNLYIGRGTQSFEGPIAYTAITQYTTYSEITLASALQKDHLLSDIVIDSQGEPDRLIAAGTVVKIPANNQNPEIQYVTLRDAVIPSGEDMVSGVEVIALVAGSLGNAGINTITEFNVDPFTGAAVTNTVSFSNGSNIETDVELRNRLKSYATTLARGTAPSIIAAVLSVSDPDDANQVASAIITEPVTIGDPSLLYIDDGGTGFQPSFAGQSVDSLLTNATGKEEFLQLANYPVPRPQVINTQSGPFNILNGSFLRVIIDGEEETVFFNTDQFLNISSATLAEIIVAINDQSSTFKARFVNKSSGILIYPVAHNAETIQVAPLRSTDDATLYVNDALKFPTDEFSYIALYQNADRLHEKAKNASLTTASYAQWNVVATSNIIISVDGTPAQDRSFALSDFSGASSFSSLTLEDWVAAFNYKFAGLTATATASQTMIITSNKTGAASSIVVSGGTLLGKWFPNLPTESVGQSAQFELNRQTGNLRILTDIVEGDSFTAGISDAKGFNISNSTLTGTYNLSADSFGRPANMVLVADSSYCNNLSLPLTVGATISISNPSASTMRITSQTADAFINLKPGDFIYITERSSWVSTDNTGLFKIKAKGNHITAGSDTFIDVDNINVVVESNIAIIDSLDIQGFETDGLPQIWRGTYLNNPPAEPISGVINSLNKDVLGVLASIYKSNSIKLTSTTERNGSIAIPISIGNALSLFTNTSTAQFGNPPHVATRSSDKELMGIFKRTSATDTNVFLDRHVYTDIKGSLTSNAEPDAAPFSSTYSETLEATGILTPSNVSFDDYISSTSGDNKGQFRTVKAKIATDKIGTQQDTARTELDWVTGDDVQLVRPINISSEDSIVIVMDQDASTKTIDVKMSRTARVNSGSGVGSFSPTTTELSADDQDNEPGIDFNSSNVWGTSINNTNFNDYAIWMRARNWYSTGGLAGTDGKFLVRSQQYGPNGEKLRFAINYPTTADQSATYTYLNSPSWSLYSYIYSSGPARATAISAGYTISVNGPYPDDSTNFPNGVVSSGNYYDYTFSAGSLAAVQIGDILSLTDSSGISLANRGQFRIENKSGLTVRVLNPNASVTAPGASEVVTVTTVADIVGTPTVYTIDTVADVADSLDQTYFIIYDSQGSVAVWYDLNNAGNPPPPHGANRAIKIASVLTNDTAADVASKTGAVIALDNAFSVSVLSNQITVTNIVNGSLSVPSNGTSGFTTARSINGTPDTTIDGKYFIINDENGSVAVWYDVGDNGTSEPFHGADRSIRVSGVNYGDSASTVAAATVAAINPDSLFTASNLSNVITITNVTAGNVPAPSAGTSGFTVGSTNGSSATSELITNAGNVIMFPLVSNSVQDIADFINNGSILAISPVGNAALKINRSTNQEFYTYGGNSTALGYGHNPSTEATRDHINLYDGVNWVKSFQNANPNFTMKTTFTLNGVAPSIYAMDTAPNDDISDLGEQFKLIPVTIKNIYHHLTQKALSQLPIVADVRITQDRKNVQITSKQLGSSGAIEIIGGNANKATTYIIGESEVASDSSGNYLLTKVPAFPDTFNVGDYIELKNDAGVKRFSRLISSDTINVTNPSTNIIEYNYNPKDCNFVSGTTFAITDVSGSYGRPAGFVWRWTHSGGSVTLSEVNAGDQVFAFGNTLSWDQGNKVRNAGDGLVAGLPIIAVNDGANYFDVLNPYGKAQAATAIGVGNTVQICPTPIIKWNLNHANRVAITSISRTSNVVTVIASAAHFLNSGDSVDIIDSNNIPDGTYGSLTITGSNQFTFTLAGADFTENNSGASLIKDSILPTRYRLEKLSSNGLVRISRHDGQSPRFIDSGVAVDDYVIISGDTFAANNNGRFRVLAVDNDSFIIKNESATDELNTLIPFNNKGYLATWTSNSSIVTGVAGTFKNINLGDWVKKAEDANSKYLQVVAFNTMSSDTATEITLGDNYTGATAIASGISYDMLNNYNSGVYLQSNNDLVFLEGDSAAADDTLFVQNIVSTNWFNTSNIGSFKVTEVGTNATTYKPFIRINNPSGVAETNRSMSVDTSGFYIVESDTNKFSTIREISNIAIDDLNADRRAIYINPHNRSYKFSEANSTSIMHMGKLGYNTDVTAGIDGYLYYTGLLRRVQRIVDGYEPDAANFPGRRGVGSFIESLPSLTRQISISINVTTDEGINLSDISNNIKSVVINYVQTLGVGDDVILSEIIAAIMDIKGVAAVTFTNPSPDTERITISSNEKAVITPDNIGIA